MTQEPKDQTPGKHPRTGFVILGIVLVVVGAAICFLNYSDDGVATGVGLGVFAVGCAILAFSPSQRNTPPNGNRGRT